MMKKRLKNVFLVLGLFLTASCFVVIYAAAKEAEKEPAKAAQKQDGVAKIKFSELSHDFGKAQQNDTLKHAFTFTNTGSGTLIIENVKAS